MSSILDIDLDYFAILDDPTKRLKDILEWANRPIDFIVDEHHRVLRRWEVYIKKGIIPPPKYILHVDEHHDMMDEKKMPNIANVVYHAMRTWPDCCVHWLVEQPIDSPQMWLSENVWSELAQRFNVGPNRPRGWPEPDLVSVCTSPEFMNRTLRCNLLDQIKHWNFSVRFAN